MSFLQSGTMRNFRTLKIWQKGMAIAIGAYELTNTFPREERFGLTGQITRAAVSIPSNIAEGSSRNSEKDYKRFIEHALGSIFELETQLLLAKSLRFGDEQIRNRLLATVQEEEKMLTAFIKRLQQA